MKKSLFVIVLMLFVTLGIFGLSACGHSVSDTTPDNTTPVLTTPMPTTPVVTTPPREDYGWNTDTIFVMNVTDGIVTFRNPEKSITWDLSQTTGVGCPSASEDGIASSYTLYSIGEESSLEAHTVTRADVERLIQHLFARTLVEQRTSDELEARIANSRGQTLSFIIVLDRAEPSTDFVEVDVMSGGYAAFIYKGECYCTYSNANDVLFSYGSDPAFWCTGRVVSRRVAAESLPWLSPNDYAVNEGYPFIPG